MNNAQIRHMVDRFLSWKLPEHFSPDGGITFKPTFNDHLPQPMRHEPIGTNLFTATQATKMVEHMLEGLPPVFGADDMAELERMVPDLDAVLTHNPLHQVYFRAGLLACREYMARFVEQGGNAQVAASIRANWWPGLGVDPGAPRQLALQELVDEVEDADGKTSFPSKPIDPSVEALPVAYFFLAA